MIPSSTSSRFPYVWVHLAVGQSHLFPEYELDIEALIDTGSSGGISIPAQLLPPTLTIAAQTIWTLADGSTVFVPTYRAYARIGNLPVVEAELITLPGQPLLGRGITNNFGLDIDHGTTVTLTL